MINHARNLLMGVRQQGFSPNYPGEEYIPPTFIPRKLTPPLRLVRHLLFGETPDRLFLNYRIRQLMMLLHSTELQSYIYALDPRVTYLPFSDDDLFSNVFGMEISQLAGDPARLYVRGTHEPNEAQGKLEQFWDITVLVNNRVRVDKRREPFASTEYDLNYNKGMTTAVPLTGTGLSLQWHPVAAGTRWQLQSRARPTTDLGLLLPRIVPTLGSRGDQEVFPAMPPAPVSTFERIWRSHEVAAYRYSALLLAVIWRINQLPQQERN